MRDPEVVAAIVEAYEAGLSLREVGQLFGYTGQNISKVLESAGVERQDTRETRDSLEQRLDAASVSQEYLSGTSLDHLATKHGTSTSSMVKYLRRHRIEIRGGGPRPKLSDEDRAEIKKQYANGSSGVEIGRVYSVNPQTVIKALRKQGVEIRSRPECYKRWSAPKTLAAEYETATVSEIAYHYGVSKGTIHKALRELGVCLRTRGARP